MGDGPIELARSRWIDDDVMLGFDELRFPLIYITRKKEKRKKLED